MRAENQMYTTKVYYYFDDDKTPYLSEVPVPPERLTLGEFKKVFNRRNYKYFYQAYDSDIKRFDRCSYKLFGKIMHI